MARKNPSRLWAVGPDRAEMILTENGYVPVKHIGVRRVRDGQVRVFEVETTKKIYIGVGETTNQDRPLEVVELSVQMAKPELANPRSDSVFLVQHGGRVGSKFQPSKVTQIDRRRGEKILDRLGRDVREFGLVRGFPKGIQKAKKGIGGIPFTRAHWAWPEKPDSKASLYVTSAPITKAAAALKAHLQREDRRHQLARTNPKKKDIYDPRMEAMRAVTQGMYESRVKQAAGMKSTAPFRDGRGKRLDVRIAHYPNVFGMRTAVGARRGRIFKGTQDPTTKSIRESRARYRAEDPQTGNFKGFTHLVNNRQDYEESLALPRQSGFYRATPEHTKSGVRYFVWPLRPGQHVPKGFPTLSKATAEVKRLNKTADPRKTKRWWKPITREISKRELSHWLPPDSAFQQLKMLPKREKTPPPLAVEVGRKKGKVSIKKGKMRGVDVWKIYVGKIWTGKYAHSPIKAAKMAKKAG